MRIARSITGVALAGALIATPLAEARQSSPRAAKADNIVQVAVKAGSFKTLVKLVTAAGLAPTLSGKGPFTVLAPTDAAFKKVPAATLAALGKDKAKLKAVLLYHVIAGKVPAKTVVTLKTAKTLNGASIKIAVKGGKVKINGANVIKTDIMASNGIIHVIDSVLLPPAA